MSVSILEGFFIFKKKNNNKKILSMALFWLSSILIRLLLTLLEVRGVSGIRSTNYLNFKLLL